jgi:hypothetical protein
MSKSLIRTRARAFTLQDGRCIYCSRPMWVSDPQHFAVQQNLTVKQARRFQCTAEHLYPRKDGGDDSRPNIAAACRFCNKHRHMRKAELTPEQFRAHVHARLERGRWHPKN